uniref:ABC transporter ATP-binding protein n=1 Tax=Pristionchus pacificus TaxID=54126 RepID=A0A8R1Z466_PRIPA
MLSTLAARASTCLRCGTSSSAARSACFSTISGTTRRKMLQVGKKLLAQPAIRNVAVVDTKRASAKLGRSTWKDLRAIFKLAGPYKGRIILGLSFLGISSSVFLLTPRTLGKLIDEFDDTKKQEPGTEDATLLMARYFKEHPVALAGVLLIGAAAIAARVYCMHTAGQLIINDLRKKVFASVLKQDMKFFDKNKVGEIVSRLSTDALIVGYSVSMNLSDGARALVTCLGSGSLMVYTSPALCKVMFFVIPIMVGTFAVFGRLQRKYTLEMQDAVAAANQVATERLGSVKTVRMLVAEPKERAAYGAKIQNIWDISKKEGAAKGVMFGSFQFTGYMALSTILFYGSTLISKGLLTYGELSSFCLYAVLSAASLSNMSGFFVEIMKGLGASARLFELRDQKPMIPLVGGIKKENVEKEITFENVTFAYPDRDRLFSNISFQVPAGKITAVVGPSGSGKSTIASLMLRLYEPDGGRILVDGVDLKDMDPSVWRRNIGTVGQEPVLFSTSIRENIVYGAEHPEQVTEAQIEEAAKQSNSWEFLRRFPDGLNTMVGEHGSTLSGGQKQRVAIARALVTNPRILILDEATSALDATSEYLVRVALNRLLENSQQTVLIIAHRLSTIKHADQIVVIDQGTVVERGTFDELVQIEDGVFKKLVEKQTIGWNGAAV